MEPVIIEDWPEILAKLLSVAWDGETPVQVVDKLVKAHANDPDGNKAKAFDEMRKAIVGRAKPGEGVYEAFLRLLGD